MAAESACCICMNVTFKLPLKNEGEGSYCIQKLF